MRCFECGAFIPDINLPCPKCGYKFDTEDNRYCPNSHMGRCLIENKMCPMGINWNTCEIKNKVDKESEF